MTARTASRSLRLATALALSAAAAAGWGGSADAGGWAVASLDALPVAEPGATREVSFAILQHGVRPVDLDGRVGIEIRGHDGGAEFFPAAGDGTVGHYVATVTFPTAAGSYDWQVLMGWFGPYELAPLDVRADAAGGATPWPVLRWVTLSGSLVLAGLAIADVTVARRRRPAIG